MKTNFEIEQNYGIKHEGSIYDLHNDFDFVAFQYNVTNRSFELRFERNSGDWVKTEIDEIIFIHKTVSYLSISPRDDAYTFFRMKEQ